MLCKVLLIHSLAKVLCRDAGVWLFFGFCFREDQVFEIYLLFLSLEKLELSEMWIYRKKSSVLSCCRTDLGVFGGGANIFLGTRTY